MRNILPKCSLEIFLRFIWITYSRGTTHSGFFSHKHICSEIPALRFRNDWNEYLKNKGDVTCFTTSGFQLRLFYTKTRSERFILSWKIYHEKILLMLIFLERVEQNIFNILLSFPISEFHWSSFLATEHPDSSTILFYCFSYRRCPTCVYST